MFMHDKRCPSIACLVLVVAVGLCALGFGTAAWAKRPTKPPDWTPPGQTTDSGGTTDPTDPGTTDPTDPGTTDPGTTDPGTPTGPQALRTFLICYRWLTSSAADSETTWWASHASFFVSGSTDDYRNLLRTKTDSPIIRYINVNNITRSEINGQVKGHPDWDALMAWLRAYGLSKERMFYHFAQDTVCRPVNMSATTDTSTENKFVYVWALAGKIDVTDRSWLGTTPYQVLGLPGEDLVIGSDERFDTLNVALAAPAGGWSGQWEYRTAAGWQPLPCTDGTAGLTRSGVVTFTPPVDWVADPASQLYQVRLVCTQASQAPVFQSIRGRDYIALDSAGSYHFPGWSPQSDLDSNGYLDSVERVLAPAATARFAYEARVPAFWVGRYVMNVADPQVQQWTFELAALAQGRIAPPYNGIFVDNGWYAMPLDSLKSGGATLEPSAAATWQQGTMACLDAVKQAVGTGPVILNTGNYTQAIYDQFLQHCDGWLGELWIRPCREFTATQLTLPRTRDMAGKISLIHARLDPIDGDVGRGQILALALYYLCAGERTYFFPGDNYGAKPYDTANWFGAMGYAMGAATGETVNLAGASGAVPVYARTFGNGLVLARPLPRYDANYTDAGVIALPAGVYQPLLADGTLGPALSGSITLRNAEGAILVRVG